MERAITADRQFPISGAMAISVALHLLVLLISLLWIPFSLMSAPPPKPEESVLRFSFAPTEDAEQDVLPAGQVPFETPQQQAEALPDYEPAGRPSLQTPSPPQQPVPELERVETRPPVEAADEPTDVEKPIEEPDRPQRDAEPSAAEFPPAENAPWLSDPTTERSSTETNSSQPLDLGRAMQEFSEAVARARAASPPSSAGGGENRNVFVPDPAQVPSSGFGVGNLMFESRDYDWNDYARSIYWEIWKAWHRRLHHTTYDFERWGHEVGDFSLNHQSQIRFVIEASGQVTEISVEFPSGCPPLDASATDALAEVVLQPLPADFPRDREVVHARFIAIGHIMAMRQTLRYLRANGYF